MTSLRDAARAALEAWFVHGSFQDIVEGMEPVMKRLYNALAAEPTQEQTPVAWQLATHKGDAETWIRLSPPIDDADEWRPLFAHPAPTQEPVAWMHDQDGRIDVIHDSVRQLWLKVGRRQNTQFMREIVPCKVEHYTIPLYARSYVCHPAPAQTPMTDEDIQDLYRAAMNQTLRPRDDDPVYRFARAVEAFHGNCEVRK